MASSVRAKSASGSMSNLNSTANIAGYKTYITVQTYFLQTTCHDLPEVDAFDVLNVEHTDAEQDGKIVETLRFWKMTPSFVYYVKRLSWVGQCVEVTFWKRTRADTSKLEVVHLNLPLSNDYIVNPLFQDYKPRMETINHFTSFKNNAGNEMQVTHVVKLFNACYNLSVEKDCGREVTKSDERKRHRLGNVILETWANYPRFADRYRMAPIVLQDQHVCGSDKTEAGFCSIVLVLPLKLKATDYLPLVKESCCVAKSLKDIKKWLSEGKDPYPILMNKLTKAEREKVGSFVTYEVFRW